MNDKDMKERHFQTGKYEIIWGVNKTGCGEERNRVRILVVTFSLTPVFGVGACVHTNILAPELIFDLSH